MKLRDLLNDVMLSALSKGLNYVVSHAVLQTLEILTEATKAIFSSQFQTTLHMRSDRIL